MASNKPRLLLWCLALLPVVVATAFVVPDQWQTPSATLNIFGRLTGIAGLSCLLAAAILSSRVPGFDRHFGGLTKLWRTHHQIASVSFLCLLAHSLLLAFSVREVSLDAVVSILLPSSFLSATALGWLALLLMMIFLAPSYAFFGEPKYQRWKLLHRLAGLAVILALWHTFLLQHSIPHPWDEVIWLLYAGLALGAVAYRFIFSKTNLLNSRGRFSYRVDGISKPANNVVELSLQAKSRAINYLAGQFIYLTPHDQSLAAGCGQEHPYTISSSPSEQKLRVTIKDLGDASRALQTVTVNSEVSIEGPYGAFFREDIDSESQLWIAGGIGITPFLSRARYLLSETDEVDVHLIFCVQDESRAIFADELQQICKDLPGFNLTLHYFYREGPLSWDFINAHCSNMSYRSCYVCGPPGLNDWVVKQLSAHGVGKRNIHTEEFNLL